jgi:hypothetical protein
MTDEETSEFKPISFESYVALHLKANPDFAREEISALLRAALNDHNRGKRCGCGNPIWVIGSAVAGNACFTCITGDSVPDDDYELAEAMQIIGTSDADVPSATAQKSKSQ